MKSRIKHVLLDLDGTLIDPKIGITHSIAYALEKLGHPVSPEEDLTVHIGPNLHDVFLGYLKSPALADQGVVYYRERFGEKGIYENDLYPGVIDLLSTLVKNKFDLFLATAKPHFYAHQILDHLKITSFFKTAFGSELNGVRSDKTDLIKHILTAENLRPEECLMLGDRRYDIIGAKNNGVRSVGALWGYGSREEFEAVAADHVIEKPADLIGLLDSL